MSLAEHSEPRVPRDTFFASVMDEANSAGLKALADGRPRAVFMNCHTGRTFHTDDLSKIESERIYMHVGTVHRTFDTRIDAHNFALVRDEVVRYWAILSAWKAYEARERGRIPAPVPEITAGPRSGSDKTNGG